MRIASIDQYSITGNTLINRSSNHSSNQLSAQQIYQLTNQPISVVGEGKEGDGKGAHFDCLHNQSDRLFLILSSLLKKRACYIPSIYQYVPVYTSEVGVGFYA